MGNAYSAFSYLLRESKLVAGESERAIYYNMDVELLQHGDLTDEEATRWDVAPLGVTNALETSVEGHARSMPQY